MHAFSKFPKVLKTIGFDSFANVLIALIKSGFLKDLYYSRLLSVVDILLVYIYFKHFSILSKYYLYGKYYVFYFIYIFIECISNYVSIYLIYIFKERGRE